MWKILGVAAALVVVVAVGGIVGLPYVRGIGSGEVRRLCAEAISPQLVSPASMSFPQRGEPGYSAPSRIGNTWNWDGVVDSENAYGAALRSQFECIAFPELDSANVTLTGR